MLRQRLWAGWLVALMPVGVLGQGAAAPITSPQAAYEQAVAPVEITHRAISNWSDTETAALAVAVRQAKDGCAARVGVVYAGEDLIGYARLCALGQQWPTVVGAATAYLKGDGTRPQRARAYGYLVEGALRMNDEKAALARALDMLGAVPYTALTDEVMGEALRYMRLAYTADALALAGVRETTLLRVLGERGVAVVTGSAGGVGAAGGVGGAADAVPAHALAVDGVGEAGVVPVHVLFADGLGMAALEQYDGQMEAAAATVKELEAAVPAGLGADETVPMAAARRQYGLLGTRLPEIGAAASLFSPTETPRINRRFGTATILLLFPPWCAQCVRSAKEILPVMFRLNSEGAEVHVYGLLADDPPPVAAAAAGGRRGGKSGAAEAAASATGAPKTAAETLRGTPTLVVSPGVAGQFGAADFPFVIATDHDGVIRLLLEGAPENAMAAGSTLDQIASHVARQWPVPEAKE